MLGIAVGFMVYLGGPTVLLDRFLLIRSAAQPVDVSEPAAMFEAEGHRAP